MSGFTTTDTFGTMIDEAILRLQGWSMSGDQIVTLSSGIDSGDTSITVSDSTALSRGMVEIESELIWIDNVSGGIASVPAWGRGFKGTTAAAHSANAAVYVSPAFPRSVVGREINNAVRALYPTLFAIGEDLLTFSATEYQYSLSATVETPLAVQWWRDSLTGWIPVEGWEARTITATTDFANGKFLKILDPVPSGASVKVTYAKIPSVMTSESDVFTTATGLLAGMKEVVLLGALSVLAGSLDLARITSQPAEAVAMAGTRPVGIATQVAGDLRKQYAARIEQERQVLVGRYPLRAHKVW